MLKSYRVLAILKNEHFHTCTLNIIFSSRWNLAIMCSLCAHTVSWNHENLFLIPSDAGKVNDGVVMAEFCPDGLRFFFSKRVMWICRCRTHLFRVRTSTLTIQTISDKTMPAAAEVSMKKERIFHSKQKRGSFHLGANQTKNEDGFFSKKAEFDVRLAWNVVGIEEWDGLHPLNKLTAGKFLTLFLR